MFHHYPVYPITYPDGICVTVFYKLLYFYINLNLIFLGYVKSLTILGKMI